MWFPVVVAVLGTIIASACFYLRRISSYWTSRNVPSFGNIFSGCFKENMNATKSLSDVVKEFYLQTRDKKCVGTFMFGKPILVVNDPEIIKRILVSDFNDFNSHGFYYDLKNDPISGNLFVLEGADWKNMRTKLSPIFTTGKIKYMFQTVLDCVHNLDHVIPRNKASVVDTQFAMSSLSIDVIASVAFGIEANCLQDPEAEFGKMGRAINSGGFIGFIRFMIQSNMHWLNKLLGMHSVENHIENFLKRVIYSTVAHREENNISRGDFLDLMIRLKNSGEIEGALNAVGGKKGVTLDEITAQAFVFFIAGFETTSQANMITLLQLAKNKNIQRRVQEECDKTFKQTQGQITYEAVNAGMHYTEQVLRETMRMYPGLQVLIRSTMKKVKVPLTDIELDKGTTLWIPLAALHRDPDCFPNPDKFDPDRFTEENKASIPSYMYMPFGDGPRICIGMRLALVQMKAVMLYLLSKFDVDVVEETTKEVKLCPRAFFPRPLGSFKLKFTPRANVPQTY